ncbi:hypothetical protein GALL_283470 [mine drainage metagenome]|uniref:Protein containing DUF484 n=1 Tax=mine drainage metagenome TaxID=410659 RepID=A0A1J5R1F1_9ZZZZ
MTTTQQENQTKITAEQISAFLRSEPHFFEQHANLLSDIFLPSPHGSGVISLAERQQLAQRDKIRMLEGITTQMIKNAEENEVISEKVHKLSVQLLTNQSFITLQEQISEILELEFSVSQSLLRIWIRPSNSAITQDDVFTAVDEDFSSWVMSLAAPYCGTRPAASGNLLDENLHSFAFIPLAKQSVNQRAFGVLILGAEDKNRFKSDMGTMYLERIGELVATALVNHLFALNL